MVSGKLVAIAALAVCLAAVGVGVYTLPSDDVSYPGAMSAELQDFRVVISYHLDKIYEGAEFRVEVFDKDTEKVVEGANVSFMLSGISLTIPKEGFVYFYAPDIKDKYLLHPNDTSRTFPITVKKAGYNTHNTTITVYLLP